MIETQLAEAIVNSPYVERAETLCLELVPRGKHQKPERFASDRVPRTLEDAEALVTDWTNLVQSEAEAREEVIIYALVFLDDAGERLGRMPSRRAEPKDAAKKGKRFSSDVEGANAILQEIVMTWSGILVSVQNAQAKHIEAQTEALRIAKEREIEEIRVRERLASREHERELELAREGSRQELTGKLMELFDEVKPLIGNKQSVGKLRESIANMPEDKRAQLMGTLASTLDKDAFAAVIELLKEDSEGEGESSDES